MSKENIVVTEKYKTSITLKFLVFSQLISNNISVIYMRTWSLLFLNTVITIYENFSNCYFNNAFILHYPSKIWLNIVIHSFRLSYLEDWPTNYLFTMFRWKANGFKFFTLFLKWLIVYKLSVSLISNHRYIILHHSALHCYIRRLIIGP